MNITRVVLLTIFLAAAIQGAVALSCINISTGGTEDMILEPNTQNYVSLRVLNSSADGRICESGIYGIQVELYDSNDKLEDILEYSLNDNNFALSSGENKRVLLTLIPEEFDGNYRLKVTAIKYPTATEGTIFIYTTSALINIRTDNNGTITERPFWVDRVDCPDGTVITKGEECPVVPIEKENNASEEVDGINIFLIVIGALVVLLVGIIIGGIFLLNTNKMGVKNKKK